MEKIVVVALIVAGLLAFTLIFGCTTPVEDTNTPITNSAQAANALNDASTGLSGVKNTLDDVDADLTS